MTGRQRIDWASSTMPVLAKIREDFEAKQPLKGIKVGVCLHLTKETAVLLETLKAGGAQVCACASNPLSTQDDVVKELIEQNISVVGKYGESMDEYNLGLKFVALQEPQIVIDDGGDLTKEIHSKLSQSNPFVMPMGGLEETTTGINVIKQMILSYPIFNVNGAKTKSLFDNVYGTGQSTVDALMRATNGLLAGKTFVVAGYGNCGKGLAKRAQGMGCNVIVTEIDPVKALQAHMDGYRVMGMREASELGDIFVTVTGNINVIDFRHFNSLKEGAILANAGHFDVEINGKELKSLSSKSVEISANIKEYTLQKTGQKVYLLSEGRLVNLAAAEGHPSAVMDMSFANQALGVEFLVNHAKEFSPKVHDLPEAIDNKVALMKLESFGIVIDELSPQQKEYLGHAI